jgi:hypothetical protein
MSGKISRFLPGLLTLTALTACGGGGGGGGGGDQPGNLTIGATTMQSNAPNVGHELEVATEIGASRAYDSVPVGYYLLRKEDVDAGVDEVRQHELGNIAFDQVAGGRRAYNAVIRIPTDVEPNVDYYLVAQVDPVDEIVETDEEDNVPPEGTAPAVVRIEDAWTDTPDIVLEDVVLDTEAIVLKSLRAFASMGSLQDVQNHHFGATVTVTTTGANDVTDLDLTVGIELPGGSFLPLQIWNRDNASYQDSYVAERVVAGEPNSIHLDVFVPESVLQQLLPFVQNGPIQTGLQVLTNRTAGIAEWDLGSRRYNRPDNGVNFDVTIVAPFVLPPQPGGLHWSEGFEKTWTNKFFGVGLALGAEASLDERGAIAQADAEVPVFLAGERFQFFDANIYSRTDPNDSSNSRYSVDVEALGVTVYTRLVEDPNYVRTEDWNVAKTAEARSLVWVGPVPIRLTAGATGTIGFRTTVDLDTSRAILTAGPYADAGAFAEARVDLAVVSAGVAGNMTIVADEFTAEMVADMDIINGGDTLLGTLTFSITNELEGPNGRVYLFANYPAPKWCKVPFVGRVPCGVVQRRAEKTLTRFATFRKVDILFEDVQTTSVDLTQS